MKDVPATHFKIIVDELNTRYKICLALSALVDEFGELGSSLGKNLSKLGSQSFLPGHSQWLPTYRASCESISKMSTTSGGKQWTGFSSNLSQNISRTFPEQIKLSKKRVTILAAKINAHIEEYKKAKMAYQRNYDKYQRTINEAETAIRARRLASEADVTKKNNPGKTGKESGAITGNGAPASGGAATVTGTGTATGPTKDESFMNRSFSKMLSKIAPAEKNAEEQCRELMRDVDSTEKLLAVSSKRLHDMRAGLEEDIAKALEEIEVLETQRLNVMKEGLSSFCIAAELSSNQLNDTIIEVLPRTTQLDATQEVIQLMEDVESIRSRSNSNSRSRTSSGTTTTTAAAAAAIGVGNNSPDSSKSSTKSSNTGATTIADAGHISGSDSEVDDVRVNMNNELQSLFGKGETLAEAMEYFRLLARRFGSSLSDVAELETTFVHGSQRVLDRHGFARNEASQWVYAIDYSSAMMNAHNHSNAQQSPTNIGGGGGGSGSAPPPPAAALAGRGGGSKESNATGVGGGSTTGPTTVAKDFSDASSFSAAIGAVGASTMALVSSTQRSAELLACYEAPTTKNGWESLVSFLGHTSDLALRSSEVTSDEVCQQLTMVCQRLEVGRKELLEKLSLHKKAVNERTVEVRQLKLKRSKVASTLVERRRTLQQVKQVLDEEESGAEAGSSGVPITTGRDSEASATAPCWERDSLTAPAAGTTSTALDAVLNNGAADTSGGGGGNSAVEEEGDASGHSPVSLVAAVTTSAPPPQKRSSLFRKGGLKQVVGFESPADRYIRIDKQINALEGEEKDLEEKLKLTEQGLHTAISIAKRDVSDVFGTTKDFLGSDLNTMKSAMECLMNWKNEVLVSSKRYIRQAKSAHDAIDVEADARHFARTIIRIGTSINHANSASGDETKTSGGDSSTVSVDGGSSSDGGVNSSSATSSANSSQDTSSMAAAAISSAFSTAPTGLIDIPEADLFTPIESELLRLERNDLGQQPRAIVPPSPPQDDTVSGRSSSSSGNKNDNSNNDNNNDDDSPGTVSIGTVSEAVELEVQLPTSSENAVDNSTAVNTTGDFTEPSVIEFPAVGGNVEHQQKNSQILVATAEASPALPISSPSASISTAAAAAATSLVVEPVEEKKASEEESTATLVDPDIASKANVHDGDNNNNGDDGSNDDEQEAEDDGEDDGFGDNGMENILSDTSTTIAANKLTKERVVEEPRAELSKFGLTTEDRVLESFSCALYPKKSILTHGRMFITQHYLAFSGFPDTRVLLLLKDIAEVHRMNTLYYVPNALSIVTVDRTEYFFGSFIDRQQCYNLLTNLSNVGRKMASMDEFDASALTRTLEFGYIKKTELFSSRSQTINTSMSGSMASSSASPVSRNDSAGSGVRGDVSPKSTVLGSDAESDGSVLAANTAVAIEDRRSRSGRTKKQIDEGEEEDDGIDVSSLFAQRGIELLQEEIVNVPPRYAFQRLWRNGSAYRDFLVDEGELEMKEDEWSALKDPVVREDISKLPFRYEREFTYLHARTTMLMFGPKNAPTVQNHYLYIPKRRKKASECSDNSASSSNAIDSSAEESKSQEAKTTEHDSGDSAARIVDNETPSQGVVLTVTNLDGVPMCDVFRVTQYWSFHKNPQNSAQTVLRVGLNVFFVKSSMLKSQIYSGSKDEIVPFTAKWLKYAQSIEADLAEEEVKEEDDLLLLEADIATTSTGTATQDTEALGLRRRRASGSSNNGTTSTMHATTTAAARSDPYRAAVAAAGSVDANHTLAAARHPVVWGLVVAIACIAFVLYRQSVHSNNLAQQINLLSRRIESSQTAMEVALRQSKDMMGQMEQLLQRMERSE